MSNDHLIEPNWPVPAHIKAYTTLRTSPSKGQFKKNHDLLKQDLTLPADPIWLNQTHTTRALLATPTNADQEGDAIFTDEKNQACVVLTSDCLPVLLCNREGTAVAAIHAGWRGLGGGIIENTLREMKINPSDLIAWLGPAISQKHFEVGNEVRDLFLTYDTAAISAFIPSPQGRWLADLYLLAKQHLRKLGVNAIYGGEHCTFSEQDRFYSYRREKDYLGSMATIIWIGDSSLSNKSVI